MHKHRTKIISILILFSVVLFCVKADAAWFMIFHCDEVENIQCEEDLTLISFSIGEEDLCSCVPDDIEMDEPPVPENPPSSQTPDGDHEGPYEGTPLGGPLFN